LISAFWTGSILQFTQAWYGYQIVAVYGFFSMSMFGAIYYIVPRLAGCEWLSVRLIRNHFWFSVYGIATDRRHQRGGRPSAGLEPERPGQLERRPSGAWSTMATLMFRRARSPGR